MEQSWGSVEELLKDLALVLMNTGFGKHSNFNFINHFYAKVL
ncbi:hypothetical protein [Myroides injenensis]|nr:hypothetical protein [Myroides injenensis]